MSNDTATTVPVRRSLRLGCLWVFAGMCIFVFGWCHYTPLNRFPALALEAIRSDPEAIFYSIDPWPEKDDVNAGFHGHRIVGQMQFGSTADRAAIIERLSAATRGAWDAAACFEPRHAFRATTSNGRYDLLVCFHCGEAVVYHPDGHTESVFIIAKPDFFNDFLKAHRVPLPER